jgi:acyl-CoA thioesterase-1
MRSFVLGCAMILVGGGCSRPPPAASEAPPSPPAPAAAAVTTQGATLRLATAIEESDAGAAVVLPSLTGKTVLHVGDSMVGGNWGLTKALEQKFTAEGAKFIRDYKVSESIISYDHSPKLKSLVDKHHPDIVILTLGTNDVFVPYPASMAGNVQNIVKRIGARECYWMGPPTWKPDTGIVQVLKDNVTPCKFYDGSNLKLQRGGDGIHPTDRGGADWAASFWTFFRVPAGTASTDAGAPSPAP